MLTTIQFNYKSLFRAVEIYNIRTNPILAKKLVAVELLFSQPGSEKLFSVRLVLPKSASSLFKRRIIVVSFHVLTPPSPLLP